MKTLLTVLVIITSIIGCMPAATVYTRHDAMPKMFDASPSFDWENPPGVIIADKTYGNTATKKFITSTVSFEMERIGIVKDSMKPTFQISYEFLVERKQEVRIAPFSYFDEQSYTNLLIHDYQKGVLCITVKDASSSETIWQGVAESLLLETPDENFKEAMRQAIREVVDKFKKTMDLPQQPRV